MLGAIATKMVTTWRVELTHFVLPQTIRKCATPFQKLYWKCDTIQRHIPLASRKEVHPPGCWSQFLERDVFTDL